jgi:PAS domain-containing protein
MTNLNATARPALRLVGEPSAAPVEWSWFCGHCAAPARDQPPAPTARVCTECGLGLLLETRHDLVPGEKDAFVVVDHQLLVQGVSRQAEGLLGVTEEAAVNRPLTELLVPADAEAQAPARFAAAVAEALGGDEPVRTTVRPWNTFGVRMRARIVSCGPPRAALLVLDDSPPRLRAVGD